MTTGASSYRWRIPEQESARKSSSGYSIHCSLQNRAVWGWACRSAVRSLRPMMASYGLPRTNPKAPFFSLCCPLTVRRLLVLYDKSNLTTSRLVRASLIKQSTRVWNRRDFAKDVVVGLNGRDRLPRLRLVRFWHENGGRSRELCGLKQISCGRTAGIFKHQRQAVVVVRQRDWLRRPVSVKFSFESIFVLKPLGATERRFFCGNKQDRSQAVARVTVERDVSLRQRREYVARELLHAGLPLGGLLQGLGYVCFRPPTQKRTRKKCGRATPQRPT